MQRLMIGMLSLWFVVLFNGSAMAQGVTATTEAPAAAATPAPAMAAPASAAPAEPVEEPEETLVTSGGKIASGGYGGPFIRFGPIAGRDGLWVGGKGGWIINHAFVIGGAGMGLANQPHAPSSINDPAGRGLDLQMGYGGLMLEYFLMPKKLIHATASALVGAGSISVVERNAHMQGCGSRGNSGGCGDFYSVSDNFFVFEPEVGIEANVVSFFRVNLGATYRVVTGVNGIGLENRDVRGVTGALTLKFGKF